MHEHVMGMKNVFEEIDLASKEQNEGIRQVNQAMDELNKVVQENAAQSEEAASIADQLDEYAYLLNQTTEKLITMVKRDT
jgi:methyl-accepting chemotaxis protein